LWEAASEYALAIPEGFLEEAEKRVFSEDSRPSSCL
jgi:hypothetical protein